MNASQPHEAHGSAPQAEAPPLGIVLRVIAGAIAIASLIWTVQAGLGSMEGLWWLLMGTLMGAMALFNSVAGRPARWLVYAVLVGMTVVLAIKFFEA